MVIHQARRVHFAFLFILKLMRDFSYFEAILSSF